MTPKDALVGIDKARLCEHCGYRFDVDAPARKRFCSTRCKKNAYAAARRAKRGSTHV